MPIFMNDMSQRNIRYTSGSRGSSQAQADEFTARIQSQMKRLGKESQLKTLELTGDFKDFNLNEETADLRKNTLKQAAEESKNALASLSGPSSFGKIASISELTSRRDQKRQRLLQTKKSLDRAEEFYKASGASFSFNETGYNPFTPEASTYEAIFDQAVEQRKQQYTEQYGQASFDELGEGYGMSQDYLQSNMTAEQYEAYQAADSFTEKQAMMLEYIPEGQDNRIGQRDIMDMVMSDITGMSYDDLAALNTYRGSDTDANYTSDQLSAVRDFYISSNMQAFEAANKRAASEDAFRKEAVDQAKSSVLSSGKALEKTSKESLGQSKEQVQLQLRELDESYMKKLGSFNTGPKKKKVRQVSFTEDRPTQHGDILWVVVQPFLEV